MAKSLGQPRLADSGMGKKLARQDATARDFGDTFVWREGGRVITIEVFRTPTAQARQTPNRTRL